jgi:arylsulfatase A-like enzyme
MGYGDIGPFGSKLNRTPRLDRMAAEGMKLTSFYAAPVCTPSRAQLMTGCYAKRVSLPDVIFPACPIGLSSSERTVADLLKVEGYATMCIGKWHLGDQPAFLPTQHGFDHYLGLPYSNDMGGSGKPGAAKPPLPLVRDRRVIEAPVEQNKLVELYTNEAIKFITANKDHPFFLYLPHTAVHVPLHPGKAFQGKSNNGRYGDWVEEVDWSTGRVLDTLHDLNLDANTFVLFTSDNGPWRSQGKNGGVAGPLRGGKSSTWEGGMREPTIARWPGKIAAGTVNDAVMSEMDILPTLVKLAGGTVPIERPIDGKEIWPLLSGKSKQSPHEALFYFSSNRLEAVRSGPWKLAIARQIEHGVDKEPAHPNAPFTPILFNLDNDIGETTDVAAQHPEIVKRLQGYVQQMDADLGIKGRGPGVRPPGRVKHPQPLLKRSDIEYD